MLFFFSSTVTSICVNLILEKYDKYCFDKGWNLLTWLILLYCSICLLYRKVCSIFSPSESEELLVIVISLLLDRGLEGLLLILGDCLNSLVLYFNTSEWESSCVMVAESIAQR
jgi:hypothetical protein